MAEAEVQDSKLQGPWSIFVCPDCGRNVHGPRHICDVWNPGLCERVEVVPREVAERLARALEENQRLRYSSHAGKVAAQWVAADEALAEFRAVFSKAGDRKIPSNAHEAEEFDARQAGRRVVEKHGDALRRLSDEAEEA